MICKRAMKALISLRECEGWSGPALSENCIRALSVRCTSYVYTLYCYKNRHHSILLHSTFTEFFRTFPDRTSVLRFIPEIERQQVQYVYVKKKIVNFAKFDEKL